MIWLIWLLVAIAAFTLYCRQKYSILSSRGVKHDRIFPILGTMYRAFFRLEHIVDDVARTYKKFPEDRFVGIYELTSPLIVIRDIDLVRKIGIKDFEHFLDHRVLVKKESDPFMARNLFSLKGQEWKDMRSTLSPAFTSSKIRVMVPFMEEAGLLMIKSLMNEIKKNQSSYVDIEAKDLTTRYANDVIASCAFGLKVDSHTDKDNQFYVMGKEASNFTFKQMILFFLLISFPKLMEKLKIPVFTKKTTGFFRELVTSTMADREARHIVRPDMIHLLMEAKKGTLSYDDKTADADAGFATVEESAVGKKTINRVWSDDDLVAQAVLFFIAGFETVSSAMSFLLHELAINPDVQEKLYQEIMENEANNERKFDYNSIQRMIYLDMVVSEVLRLWPPGLALDRQCIKDYNLGRPNKDTMEDYIIRKGEGIQIPVWAIHRDPEFFPNPEQFEPERFSEENKHKIKSFTYLPFGVGPRNCIGSRFALCEVKVMVYQLIKNMELSPNEKTQIPSKLALDNFGLRLKGGHWVRMRPRNK